MKYKIRNNRLRCKFDLSRNNDLGHPKFRKDAFEQMDYSIAQGVNFFDTAELYSVPPNSESYGKISYDW